MYYDDDPDPADLLERDREREYYRWILNGSDPQDEPDWLEDDEDEDEDEDENSCRNCDKPILSSLVYCSRTCREICELPTPQEDYHRD